MKQKFDYIVIGAGTAGCVLANRLSADPGISVLLVEAGGPDKKLEIKIPGGYGKLHKSEVDWGFYTEPQENLNNRKIYLPRGKTLGGCSSTNAMAYVRGNKEDYDEWASMGNHGWSYQHVLPYFKKSEGNFDIKNEFHNQDGPVHIEFAKYFRTPFAEAFVEGCQEVLNLALNEDYNGAEQIGAGFFQFNIKNGKRWSMADAFLKPVLRRKNLTILTHTSVSKLIINNDKAEGIECYKNNSSIPELIYCSKEIIISAGSFQSPQLLMLSGIGDKEELNYHNIQSKVHLPGVGKNLQDHLFYFVSSLANRQLGVNHHLKPHNQVLGLAKWIFTNGGPMSISPLEALAFYKVLDSKEVNMQFHFTPLQIASKNDADPYKLSSFPTVDGYTILPSLLKPKSVGHLRLQSNNHKDFPLIQPNFLSNEDDLKILVKGGQDAIKVLQSNAFSKYNKAIIAPSDLSEEGLIYHIKQSIETIYHPVGTCKMGTDEMAVVNERLCVYGVEGLRVIDASIMPRIVAGNTNAPVMMIAEKAADMILHP